MLRAIHIRIDVLIPHNKAHPCTYQTASLHNLWSSEGVKFLDCACFLHPWLSARPLLTIFFCTCPTTHDKAHPCTDQATSLHNIYRYRALNFYDYAVFWTALIGALHLYTQPRYPLFVYKSRIVMSTLHAPLKKTQDIYIAKVPDLHTTINALYYCSSIALHNTGHAFIRFAREQSC